MSEEVYYNGKAIKKALFRTFVYNEAGEQKLANSWEEFEQLKATGIWSDIKFIGRAEVKDADSQGASETKLSASKRIKSDSSAARK